MQSKWRIESSTFSECQTSSSSYGAALYIYCGNIVLNQVCGYQCQSASYDGFSYIQANSNNNHNNTVIETSVSNCNANSQRTMRNVYGFINISTVNLSYNEVKTYDCSALLCQPSNPSNGYGTSITYSSFANNTAERYYCIGLSNYYNTNCKHDVKNSNITRNKGYKTIYSRGDATMTECCIRDNYIFR